MESSPDCEKGRSRKRRLSSDDQLLDDEEEGRVSVSKLSTESRVNGLRTPAFTHQNKPAELFRKDLISAMKLADSEQMQTEEYLLIQDPWRQDWEKGVQVPVNPASIPEARVKTVSEKPKTGDFKIPKKLLHACSDETFKQGMHELTGMQQLSEQVVRYDLDDLDVCWLFRVNEEREEIGEIPIHEWTMERVMEELEKQCHENMQVTIKTEEGLGIEYDEDVICDVCRSPDVEESNEMVFCDGCDICVHQACYGIQKIPTGSWLCRTCALGVKPTCILCPKSGGAMKPTKSGTKWCHVSCALWIPEVSIGCVDKMEPITKISQVPASRWALVCCMCKERTGACIQCSVKTCKTAFHVTCGISNNLDMKTILDDSEGEAGVKLKAFCPKHTKRRDRTSSDSELDSPCKEGSTPRKQLTNEEKEGLRKQKLKQLEELFYTLSDVRQVAATLQLPEDVVEVLFHFWKLKRKSLFDKALLTPKTEEAELLEKQQEDSLLARMKMFVHLRQDLERVRNLCYMVSKREKMKRSYQRLRESVFMAQVSCISPETISARELKKVAKLYHDHSLYDHLLSQTAGAPTEPVIGKCDASRESTPTSSCSASVSELRLFPSSRRSLLSENFTDLESSLVDVTSLDTTPINLIDDKDSVDSLSGCGLDIMPPQPRLEEDLSANSKPGNRDKKDVETKINVEIKVESSDEPTVCKSGRVNSDVTNSSVRLRESRRSRIKNENIDYSDSAECRDSPVHTRSLDVSSRRNSKPYSSHKKSRQVFRQREKQVNSLKTWSPRRQVKTASSRLTSRPVRSRSLSLSQQTPLISDSGGKSEVAEVVMVVKPESPAKPAPDTVLKEIPDTVSLVTQTFKKEFKEVLRKSQLIVDEKIREEVQDRLLKSTSPKAFMNGIYAKSSGPFDTLVRSKLTRNCHGNSARRHAAFSRPLSPSRTSDNVMVLNEIPPTYSCRGLENKDWYGANVSPKGSLSGYKIPKKSSHSPLLGSSPGGHCRDSTGSSSPHSHGVLDNHTVRRRIDGDWDKDKAGVVTRSREGTPDRADRLGRRLTRSHGHENVIGDVFPSRSNRIIEKQIWMSST